jgi:serine/threonine protein kinase
MTSNTEGKKENSFEKFGRYVVLKLIGKGGMGHVYLAEDPVLERKLAVKVITVESTLDEKRREEYLNRFLLEARASAKLNHQSIVAVFDAGEEKGLPWIAFEFVDGERLTDLIKAKGKLPIDKAISYAQDIASALDHAHRNKIIHRDVKPENILIDNKTGIAKLADFGIVKAPWTGYTREGTTVGSPGYMSPEQINGLELDERSDLFSLGIVLYEMFSGKHPFIRDSLASTAYATLSANYFPLSKVASNMPPEADTVIAKCLTAERKKRLGSAKELLKLLKAFEAASGLKSDQTDKLSVKHFRDKPVTPGTTGFLAKAQGFFHLVMDSVKTAQSKVTTPSLSAGSEPISLQDETTQVGPTIKKRTVTNSFYRIIKALILGIVNIGKVIIITLQELYRNIKSSYDEKQRRLIALNITIISLICLLLISGFVLRIVNLKRQVKEGDVTESIRAAKRLDKFGISFSSQKLIDRCKILIEKESLKEAEKIAQGLAQMKPTLEYGHTLSGRIAIRNGNYKEAIERFDFVKERKKGKKVIQEEFDKILADAKIQLMKMKAPASFISLIAITLEAADNPTVQEWVGATQYWLRWNAVYIMESAGILVDTVEVYILDLKYAGSASTRADAAKKLGELGDERAVPALKEAEEKGRRDPFVSGTASLILKNYFQ